MKSLKFNTFFIINLFAVLLLGFFQIQAQTTKTVKTNTSAQPVSKTQREALENVIREYLLKNPSVIREALAALEMQEAKEKQEAIANNLKKFRSEIYQDADSPVGGNKKGDVTIVVFFDYFCGYCRKTLPELQAFLAQNPSVRVIYKEFPIMGAESLVASRAALAAQRQGKYTEFHNALVNVENANAVTLRNISKKLGLNYETLKKDMNDPKFDDLIQRNQRLAASIGVDGTPAYLIGDQFIPGAVEADALAKIVAEERAKSGNVSAVKTTDELKK
jgi:protein-disulfide isomerase